MLLPSYKPRVQRILISSTPSISCFQTCRYILRLEKDRETQAKLTDAQFVSEEQSQRHSLAMQDRHRHLYQPRPPTTTPSLPPPKASSTQNVSSELGRHNFDTVISNFPYLHGARAYELKRNRSSLTTSINSAISHSPRSPSDDENGRMASVQTLWGSGPPSRSGCAVESEATDAVDPHDVMEQADSASSIEIGSLHSSSSVNSEELRRFYNDMWNGGAFMTGAP